MESVELIEEGVLKRFDGASWLEGGLDRGAPDGANSLGAPKSTLPDGGDLLQYVLF